MTRRRWLLLIVGVLVLVVAANLFLWRGFFARFEVCAHLEGNDKNLCLEDPNYPLPKEL